MTRTSTTTRNHAAVYCRISKDDAGTALGVKRQEKLCRQLAAERGYEVAEVFIDNDLSASSGKRRPAFERLLESAEAGEIDAVICYHIDRLYRRNAELERIVPIVDRTRLGILVVTASDIDLSTASGRMTARILGAAAQGEVERMGERLRAKLDELAAEGRPPGGRAPYGYNADRTINRDEAKWIERAAERVIDGWTFRTIVMDMTNAGGRNRSGEPWHPGHFQRALLNPAVVGLRVHRGEIVGEGTWQPILERSTWETVKAILSDPARRHRRGSAGMYEPYLLSGLVRSAEGFTMPGRTTEGHRQYSVRPLAIRGVRPTVQVSIFADRLDPAVVAAALARSDAIQLDADPAGDPSIDAEIEQIEAELAELAELRVQRVITMAEWLKVRTGLDEALKVARAKVRPRSNRALSGGALRERWAGWNFDQRQAALRELIDYIEVKPVGRSAYAAVEDRVVIHWRG